MNNQNRNNTIAHNEDAVIDMFVDYMMTCYRHAELTGGQIRAALRTIELRGESYPSEYSGHVARHVWYAERVLDIIAETRLQVAERVHAVYSNLDLY